MHKGRNSTGKNLFALMINIYENIPQTLQFYIYSY